MLKENSIAKKYWLKIGYLRVLITSFSLGLDVLT